MRNSYFTKKKVFILTGKKKKQIKVFYLSVVLFLLSTVNSEANARRITMVENCFGSAGEVSSKI